MGLTPECDTIKTICISNANDAQITPDVSFGGGYYLVAWSDFRHWPEMKIAVSRVTPQWVVIDTGNFISSSPAQQVNPAIAYDGEQFLVVWRHYDAPVGIYCRFIDINAQPQGSVITISDSPLLLSPAIAFGNKEYLIVWPELTDTNNIIGQIVSPAGLLIGDPIVVSSGTESRGSPSVCYDGSNYLVVWVQGHIWGQFVSNSGDLVGSNFPISSSNNDQYAPDIIFGDGEFLAVWSEVLSNYEDDIYGNVDIQSDIKESVVISPKPKIYPAQTIITNFVEVMNGQGKRVAIFDALGRQVGQTFVGRWDARSVPLGVYFLSIENNRYWFKVVKIR